MRTYFVTMALAAAGLGACSAGPMPSAEYANTARYFYELGERALNNNDYLEAIQQFTLVKNKFAYSQYAALAQLQMGETYFRQEHHVEAIDAYRSFMQAYPNHAEVPTAYWRIAQSYVEQMPSRFFLYPPAHEKDQNATKDALRALERYAQRYPEHKYAEQAREKILYCRAELADHEIYVAKFYLREQQLRSAQGRLEGVIQEYVDLPERWSWAAESLFQVYAELAQKLPDEAAQMRDRAVALAQLVLDFKAPPALQEKAQRFLEKSKAG